MIKEIKILFNFTSYILLGFLICLIGLSNVFASESYEDLGNLNDKTSFYLVYGGNTSPVQIPINQEWNFEDYNINSFIINIDNTVFKKNYTYRLTLTLPKSIITGANAYTVVDSNGDSCATGLIEDMNTNYPKFTFSCGIDTNSIGLRIYNNNGNDIITNRWWFSWTNIQLYRMINSDEELNNTIKEELSTCRDSYNLLQYTNTQNTSLNGLTFIFNEDKSITVNGTANNVTVFEFIKDASIYLDGGIYTFSGSTGGSRSTYFMEAVVGPNNTYFHSINGSETLSLVDGSYLFRAYIFVANGATLNNVTFKPMFEKGTVAHKYEPYSAEPICTNKIDQTNDKLDNIESSITNDNVDDNKVSSAFNQFEDFIDENATISTLITLPVTLFSSILSGLQNSCSPFNLGSLYGEDLILPCIDISSYLGNTLWTMIDIIISGFAIYFISQKFIKVFNNFSSMKEGDVIDD